MDLRPVAISAVFLFLFAIAGSGMVAFTFDSTAERIDDNRRAALRQSLDQLLPPGFYDNEILHDVVEVHNRELLGTDKPVLVYRARKDGWPVATVLSPVAPDGYNGSIRLLVAVKLDGTLLGVRVIEHRETPGLGDGIEAERSDWIHDFNGRSIGNPVHEKWKVRRDGGVFDQFTGATITPRAIVKAVNRALVYYQRHEQSLFEQSPTRPADS